MSHCFESSNGIRRNRRHAVGLIADILGGIVINTRRVDRILNIHIIVDHALDDLRNGREDAGSARAADGQIGRSVRIKNDGRAHGAERALAAGHAVDRLGLGREVSHFIIHDKSVARNGNLVAIEIVDGLRTGDHVAPLVDHGEGRGRTGLIQAGVIRLVAAAHIGDLTGKLRSIVLAGQALERHAGKGGIRHILCAVGKGHLERFGEVVDVLRRVDFHTRHVKVLKNVQDFNQVRTTGGGGGQRVDCIITVSRGYRLANLDLVISKVLDGHHAAVFAERINDRLSDLALVERIRAALGDHAVCLGKILVRQDSTDFEGQSIFIKIIACNLGHIGNFKILVLSTLLHRQGDNVSILSEIDSRLHQFGTGKLAGAKIGERVLKTGHFTRHARRHAADLVQLGVIAGKFLAAGIDELCNFTFVVKPHFGRRIGRRDLAEINDLDRLGLRIVDGHKTAAAKAGGVRLNHAERIGDRNCSIYSISASLKNIKARFGGIVAGACDRAIPTGSVTVIAFCRKVLVIGKPDVADRFRLLILIIDVIRCGIGIFLPAGDERQRHHDCKKKRKILFHFLSS